MASSTTQRPVSSDADRFASTQPAELQSIFRSLYVEGEHNAVLNLDYLGLAAMEQRDYATAEKAFDAAIARIETVYANNPNAQKAKSLFAAERVKDFKGEPYERAMTYYYRGVLYLRAGDYQNARASFLAAEWQSTLSESEAYDSSFGLMDYLAAWSSYCDGDDSRANDLYDRAAKVQPTVFSSLPSSVTYIGLIDLGTGPVKYGVGQYKEKLAFKPSEPVPGIYYATIATPGTGQPLIAGDINWQATTRSGRPVDAILNGKAQWKSGTEAASSALTTVGYAATLQGMVSGNNNLSEAGAIGMVAGIAGSLFAHTMTPAADTRAWTSLPAGIGLIPLQSQVAAPQPLVYQTDDLSGPQSTSLNAHNGKCSVSWGRTRSAVAAATAKTQSPVADESKREAVNSQFRAMLVSTFPTPNVQQTAANK
jgi:tetratricopeptide (TPR) repeat protein